MATQNSWVIPGRCNLKIQLKIKVTRSRCPVYNSREKSVSPLQTIDEKKY